MTQPFQIHELDERLWRVELARPEALEDPFPAATNVYLSVSETGATGLVNAGHPLQRDALSAALQSIGVSPGEIERVVYTSWEIDCLGGSVGFEHADHLIFSPDMRRPRSYAEWLSGDRDSLSRILDWLDSNGIDVDAATQMAGALYPQVLNTLDFMPIRAGLELAVGGLQLEVLSTPGFDPGHVMLWSGEHSLLFCGNVEFDGLPLHIREVQGYLISVERALELAPELVLPNRGAPQPRGRWSLRRTLRWANNYLSNVGAALIKGPTLAEFVERDRGRGAEAPFEFALLIRQYKPFLDELARARMIETEGEGLDMRYGIDVDDPREKLR